MVEKYHLGREWYSATVRDSLYSLDRSDRRERLQNRQQYAVETWEALARLFPPCLPPLFGEDELVERRAKFVYLDQWVWRELADARFGRGDNGLYRVFASAVWSGLLVVPLSQVHFVELSKLRGNPRLRAEIAFVMGELSGFRVVDLSDLMAWDAFVGLCKIFGLSRDHGRRRLSWGYDEAFPGESLMDALARNRVTDSVLSGLHDPPWLTRRPPPALLRESELAKQWLRLCGITPDNDGASRFVRGEAQRQAIRVAVPDAARSNVDELPLIRAIETSAPHLALVGQLLGVDLSSFFQSEGTSGIRALVEAMPFTGIWQGMLEQAHRTEANRNWRNRSIVEPQLATPLLSLKPVIDVESVEIRPNPFDIVHVSHASAAPLSGAEVHQSDLAEQKGTSGVGPVLLAPSDSCNSQHLALTLRAAKDNRCICRPTSVA